MITLNLARRILQDGTDIGDFASACKNGVITPSQCQMALTELLASLQTTHATETARLQASLTAAEARIAELIALQDGLVSRAAAAVPAAQAGDFTALAQVLADASKRENERKRAAAESALAQAQAALAALGAA